MAEEKEKLRILLGCADKKFSENLSQLLEKSTKVELIDRTDDGERLLELYHRHQTELLILDTDLIHVDGLAVALRIREQGDNVDIWLISAFHGAEVSEECAMLSIGCVIRKPTKAESLYDHIKMWTVAKAKRSNEMLEEEQFRYRVMNIFQNFDIRAGSKSYTYTVDAICACRHEHGGLTKVIYPEIAKLRATTPVNVERNIRYAVKKVWEDSSPEVLKRYFGDAMHEEGISNSAFIRAILSKLNQSE